LCKNHLNKREHSKHDRRGETSVSTKRGGGCKATVGFKEDQRCREVAFEENSGKRQEDQPEKGRQVGDESRYRQHPPRRDSKKVGAEKIEVDFQLERREAKAKTGCPTPQLPE